jgi:hypothetical protein
MQNLIHKIPEPLPLPRPEPCMSRTRTRCCHQREWVRGAATTGAESAGMRPEPLQLPGETQYNPRGKEELEHDATVEEADSGTPTPQSSPLLSSSGAFLPTSPAAQPVSPRHQPARRCRCRARRPSLRRRPWPCPHQELFRPPDRHAPTLSDCLTADPIVTHSRSHSILTQIYRAPMTVTAPSVGMERVICLIVTASFAIIDFK